MVRHWTGPSGGVDRPKLSSAFSRWGRVKLLAHLEGMLRSG
jgi:hypothetical protein